MKITAKTRTTVDDALVAALRRPLFVTVVLAGAWLALERAQVQGTLLFAGQAILITVAVLLWAGGAGRAAKIVLDALNSHPKVLAEPAAGCRFLGYTEWSAEYVAVPVLLRAPGSVPCRPGRASRPCRGSV